MKDKGEREREREIRKKLQFNTNVRSRQLELTTVHFTLSKLFQKKLYARERGKKIDRKKG